MNGDFSRLLVIFANNLNPDQDRQNVGPDLDSNRLTLNQIVFLKEFLKKSILKKSQHTAKKKHEKLRMQRVQLSYFQETE